MVPITENAAWKVYWKYEQEKFVSPVSAYLPYKLFHVAIKAFWVFVTQGRAAEKKNALRAILLLFGDVVAAARHTNFFRLFIHVFFFQCKYRNYSSTEIQWIRDSGNESCSQERTNQVSQFRNESTAEGKLFITAISGIFVVSAQGTVHTSAEKFINATLAIYQMILDLWKLKTFEEKSHYYHDLIVYEKRRF